MIYGDRFPYDYLKWNNSDLIALLRFPFCRLHQFTLSLWHESHWNFFSSELKDALSAIIHSSSLETLHISHLDVPMTFFQGMHVEKLILSSGQSPLLTTAASEGGATTISHAVVDHCEWNFFSPVFGMRFPLQIRSEILPHQKMKQRVRNRYSCRSCAVYVAWSSISSQLGQT
jgi:hypothetical protein